jgi:hypothetical protein
VSKLGAEKSNQTYANERQQPILNLKAKNYKKYAKRYDYNNESLKDTSTKKKQTKRRITKR